jgi:hypothetical protein
MSEMVERVASAVSEAMMDCSGIEYREEEPRIVARAAIKAMRVPTQAMFEAGQAGDNWSQMDARLIWRAMIDEALR